MNTTRTELAGMNRLLTVVLAIAIFVALPARAQAPVAVYEREMEQAIARIEQQFEAGQEIELPVIKPTGSAMFDQVARITLRWIVDSRGEMQKMSAWEEMSPEGQESDYTYLANPELVAQKYRKLGAWRIEEERHLAAWRKSVATFQNGMRDVRVQYGTQADVIGGPKLDELATRYPLVFAMLSKSYELMIIYAHMHAGQISPAANGLVKMDSQADTRQLLLMIKDVEDALRQFGQLEEIASP